MVALAAAHRLNAHKPLRDATMRSRRLSIAIAGRNDEVGRTDESTKCTWLGWKMVVKTGNECLLGNYMSSRGKKCYGSLLRGSFVPTKLLLVLLNQLPMEDNTSNALVVVWVGNRARCVSLDVTLHRLSAYSRDSLTLHLSTAVCIIQGKECLRVIHVLNLSSVVVSSSVARTIRRSFRALTSHMVAELLVIQC